MAGLGAVRTNGVTLVRGGMEDPPGLDAALRGVDGVYSLQTFTGPDGLAGEVRQGRAVAEAATVGFRADLAGLRTRQPNLITLETWVSKHWTVPGH